MCLLVTSVLAMWSISAVAGGYLGTGKTIYMQNAYGGWILKTNGTNTNPDGCSKDNTILEPTHGQYKELYSLILSAYMANRNVRFYVDGCHYAGYMKLNFLYLDGT